MSKSSNVFRPNSVNDKNGLSDGKPRADSKEVQQKKSKEETIDEYENDFAEIRVR